MTSFINGIKLTTIYACDVGFSSSAGVCLFHFAFYLNLGSKINAHSHLENSIHHQPAASGKISKCGGAEEGAGGSGILNVSWWFVAVLCFWLSLVLYNVS